MAEVGDPPVESVDGDAVQRSGLFGGLEGVDLAGEVVGDGLTVLFPGSPSVGVSSLELGELALGVAAVASARRWGGEGVAGSGELPLGVVELPGGLASGGVGVRARCRCGGR